MLISASKFFGDRKFLLNTSGASYEYDGRKNKLEYIISSNLFGIDFLSGLDYLKKSADMNGLLADKEIHSIDSTDFHIRKI